MEEQEIYRWLYENGGPVIRYRTATELIESSSDVDTGHLLDELVQSPQVQTWLGNLIPPRLLLNNPPTTPRVMESGIMEVHGSKSINLENVLGKLTDFGLKQGVTELDRRTLPYRKWLEEIAERATENVFDIFSMGMTADFLARAGYIREPAVRKIMRQRLDIVYDFTRKGDYDIYIKGKFLRNLPMIKPELTPSGVCCLPLIYDIIGWAAYLPERGTNEELSKADTIIEYILDEEYQKFPWGYGIIGDGTGRTWSLGWSVHLPRFFGTSEKKSVNKSVVQIIDLLINFRAARRYSWFKESLDHLEEFRTEKDTYLFPREYLQEQRVGYWISGNRMGLESGTRNKRVLELESTFWMMKFKKLLQIQ